MGANYGQGFPNNMILSARGVQPGEFNMGVQPNPYRLITPNHMHRGQGIDLRHNMHHTAQQPVM